MRRMTVFTALGVIALLLSGCAAGPADTAVDPVWTLGPTANGKTIELIPGVTTVRVMLPGNPTTGYQWEFGGVDGTAVAQTGSVQYEADPNASGRVGAGGLFTATYQVRGPGQATIHLVYRRVWEKQERIPARFDAILIVPPPAAR